MEMPRGKSLLVVLLILVPLFLTIVVKYAPLFTSRPKISAVSIVPPHLYGPKEFNYMSDDIPKRMREQLTGIPGIEIRPSPTAEDSPVGEEVSKIAAKVGADALVMTTVTI